MGKNEILIRSSLVLHGFCKQCFCLFHKFESWFEFLGPWGGAAGGRILRIQNLGYVAWQVNYFICRFPFIWKFILETKFSYLNPRTSVLKVKTHSFITFKMKTVNIPEIREKGVVYFQLQISQKLKSRLASF